MKRTSPHLVALAVVAGALTPSVVHAMLHRSVIAAGGGRSTSGNHALFATVGQSLSGYAALGSFRLCSGFWCFGGTGTTAVENPESPAGHAEFAFSPPMPNPAHGVVRFRLTLPSPAPVSFEVFDVAGRRVGEPQTQVMSAGPHDLWWSAPREQAGIYFARLRVEGAIRAERRFALVR